MEQDNDDQIGPIKQFRIDWTSPAGVVISKYYRTKEQAEAWKKEGTDPGNTKSLGLSQEDSVRIKEWRASDPIKVDPNGEG